MASISLRKTTSLASKTIKNISNILLDKTSTKKNISNNILRYKDKRNENDRRIKAQNELLAFSSVTKPINSVRLSLSQVGGTFLSRMIQFAGYVTSGWILSNMPTWIAGARELSNRIQSLNSTFTGFADNIWYMMSDIGRISTALFENMKMFDLTDSSFRVRNSMTGLIDTLDSMGDQVKEAFSVLTQPFMNVPPLGSEGKPGAYPDIKPEQPSEPSPSGGNADFWTLVAIASREDGDPQGQADVSQSIYNRVTAGVFPGGKDIKKVILARAQYQPTREYPKRNPSGNTNPEWYQITDAESAKATGYDVNTIKSVAKNITNPTLQKKSAEYIENRTDFLGKGLTPNRKSSTELRRRTPNNNIFGNFVGPASFEYGRKTVGKPSPSVVQPSSTISQKSQTGQRESSTSSTSTVTVQASPMIVTSGYGWRWGRQHAGIDLVPKNGIVPGTPVIIKKGGTIVYANIGRGNMGQILITHDDGTQSRYLHVNNFKVSAGQKVNAGQTIASLAGMGEPGIGNATGPHLHFEYYRNTSSSYSDPASVYQNYVSLGGKVIGTPSTPLDPKQSERSPSSSLVSSPSSTPQIPSEVEIQPFSTDSDLLSQILMSSNLAAKRQDIVLINDLQPASTQMPGGFVVSSGKSLSTGMNESEILNSFIKNKLLLDLNYL